jgi:hypothetical protein
MLRVANWEFATGDCVMVIHNYWSGEVGWATEVQPEFVRITLSIGISILACREELALITQDELTNLEDSANGVVVWEVDLEEVSDEDDA